MLKRSGLATIGLLFLFACNTVRVVPYEQLAALQGEQTVRFFFPSAGGSVEAYVARPRGAGPFPLVILLHGHSLIGRGAEQVLATAQALASEICFASMAISLPGYGSTEVANGSIEDATRQVVKDGLSIAKQNAWIDERRVMIYGVSRGATCAAALINEVKEISGAVLYSGAYDLERLYRETPSSWVRKLLNPNGEATPKLVSFLGEASRWRTPTPTVWSTRCGGRTWSRYRSQCARRWLIWSKVGARARRRRNASATRRSSSSTTSPAARAE